LLYVLWDLSQVDPSDLSVLFAGQGRLRIGFSELDPASGHEPGDEQIQSAVRGCWDNPFCAFDGAVGTSLICIQGDWSNVVDGKIKGQLAALALGQAGDSPYNPLYARAVHAPRPWGVTTLFAEYTGNHPPLEIDWSAERRIPMQVTDTSESDSVPAEPADDVAIVSQNREVTLLANVAPVAAVSRTSEPVPSPSFSTFWDFARAVNRSDPAALTLAGNGAESEIPMDARELRKLLSTFWFRSVFPRLSRQWQDRILTVVAKHATIPDHAVGKGRSAMHLREMTQEQRQRMLSDPTLADDVRADLHLMVTVSMLWGEEAVSRFEFTPVADAGDGSRLAALLQPFRR
jgi:hypothetical protein